MKTITLQCVPLESLFEEGKEDWVGYCLELLDMELGYEVVSVVGINKMTETVKSVMECYEYDERAPEGMRDDPDEEMSPYQCLRYLYDSLTQHVPKGSFIIIDSEFLEHM